MSDTERRRRVQQLADYLVRTIRSCPAPGIAPFTARDWLLISAAAVLPYVVVLGLVAIAPTH